MRSLIALLAVAWLAGCAGVDNTEPPAPLPDITPTLRVDKNWIRFAGTGTQGYFLQVAPYVGEGRVVVADAEGHVNAFEIDSGKRLWSVDTDLELVGGISGGDGLIVLGARSGDTLALRLENGQELWRRRLSSEVLALSGIDLGVVVARTNDGKLHALTAASGELLWQAGRKTPALSLRGASAPVIDGGQVVAGFDTGKLAVLNADRGTVLWEAAVAVPTGRSELERMVDIDAGIRVDAGVIYAAAYQGRVAALSLRDGRIRWARDISSYSGLALDERYVYVTDENGAVWALDRESGAALWRQDKLLHRSVTAPALVGTDYLVVADYQGYVHWLSRADGRLLARIPVDDAGVQARLAVDGDRVLALGDSGQFISMEPRGRVADAARWPLDPDPEAPL